jgi:hypothetical protein
MLQIFIEFLWIEGKLTTNFNSLFINVSADNFQDILFLNFALLWYLDR